MLFNSPFFIFVFLPLTLFGFLYLESRQQHRAAVGWLVLASFFFYGWWNPVYLVLILFSILFNYSVGILLTQRFQGDERVPTWTLPLGVAVNLGLLGYFKYSNFFVDAVNQATGSGISFGTVVLPLAISFFTFQQIAYLVDARRGETREHDFLHYCLFVSFFPQLIAGPIVHHREMLPQFESRPDRRVSENLSIGLTIFLIGLFKKVIIADQLALHATPVFDAAESGTTPDFFTAWTGIFAYTFQLYFDFSGYSDMAIGLARMFGVRLPLNFHSPYQADSIIEFWRRWHITLSRFLRDYLYFGLGGNRRGPARRHVNLFVTMVLGGLWHGAGWTFVAWGALHGAYLIVNHAWRALKPVTIDRWWSRLVARSLTLLSVMVAWVFFRAESFDGAQRVLAGMSNLPNAVGELLGPLAPRLESAGLSFSGGYLHPEHLELGLWLLFWIGIVWYWPNTQQWLARYEPCLPHPALRDSPPILEGVRSWSWVPGRAWGVAVGCAAAVTVLGLSRVTEFLYFQF